MLQSKVTIYPKATNGIVPLEGIFRATDSHPEWDKGMEISFDSGPGSVLHIDLRASYSEDTPAEEMIIGYLSEIHNSLEKGDEMTWTNVHDGSKEYLGLREEDVEEFRSDAKILSTWRDVAIFGALGF